MTIVALAALAVIAVLVYLLHRAHTQQVDELVKREQETRRELLSVLGKTETIALNFKRDGNGRKVTYVDDEAAIELEKRVARDGTA